MCQNGFVPNTFLCKQPPSQQLMEGRGSGVLLCGFEDYSPPPRVCIHHLCTLVVVEHTWLLGTALNFVCLPVVGLHRCCTVAVVQPTEYIRRRADPDRRLVQSNALPFLHHTFSPALLLSSTDAPTNCRCFPTQQLYSMLSVSHSPPLDPYVPLSGTTLLR